MPDSKDRARTGQRSLQGTVALLLTTSVVSVGAALLVHQLVLTSWPPLTETDRLVLVELHDVARAWPWLVLALKALSLLGIPIVYKSLTLGVAAWLAWRRRPVSAVYAVLTIVVGLQVAPTVKEVVRRPRPDLLDPVAGAGGYSFPSGHAVGVTVMALTMLVVLLPLLRVGWRRAVVLIAIGGVVAMCLARLVLGVHYLSDVLAGVLLGVGWVAATTVVIAPLLLREMENRTLG